MEEMEQRVLRVYDKFRLEIIQNGWLNISQKYHPDNNINNPQAWELWKIYKSVYKKILRETEVKDLKKL